MVTEHTPTPWHVGTGIANRIIYAEDGLAVADVFHGRHRGTEDKNAEFIVRAANNYQGLIDAMDFLVSTSTTEKLHTTNWYAALDNARTILAKAKGEIKCNT